MGLRSLLFVPGNQQKMLDKATQFRPDAFIPDIEDSVPEAEKANARQTIAGFLPTLAKFGIAIFPRVNALETGLSKTEIQAIAGPFIQGISIGKIHSAEDIQQVDALLQAQEISSGLQTNSLKIIPWLESARGIVNAYDICVSSKRIEGVAFGGEDFADDMEIERQADESESLYARHVVCTAARAAGIACYDTPFFGFRDQNGLLANVVRAKAMGFHGKFAIHPAQIEVINNAFSPSDEQIEHAKRVIAAFEEAEQHGRGSTSLDGQVIDVPVVKRARKLLQTLQ